MSPHKYKFRREQYRMVGKVEKNLTGGIVIDCACANAKFATLFRSPM